MILTSASPIGAPSVAFAAFRNRSGPLISSKVTLLPPVLFAGVSQLLLTLAGIMPIRGSWASCLASWQRRILAVLLARELLRLRWKRSLRISSSGDEMAEMTFDGYEGGCHCR